MDKELDRIINKAREFLKNHKLTEIDFEKLNEECEKKIEDSSHFDSVDDLVKAILLQERMEFEKIFDDHNFDNYNSIDVLFIVSQELDDRFFKLTPKYTKEFKELYPEIYLNHTTLRKHFIYSKMKLNIEKGISQGLYRSDINMISIGKLYREQIYQVYDINNYPVNKDSFGSIFDSMIKAFITLVANEDGANYYKHRKQLFAALHFGR